MIPSRHHSTLATLLSLLLLLWGGAATARPLYFTTLTGLYGIQEGDDLYACGVCHRRWEGTGARNDFGLTVEQQLYVGKTITDALLFLETMDADGDTYSNVDELTIHGTLPGYSCANYEDVLNPPANFQSIITPGVPTCLEPLDIDVDPEVAVISTEVGNDVDTTLTIRNNGSDDPVDLSSVTLLPGSGPSFSISPVSTPQQIPLGSSIDVVVTFAPAIQVFENATVRVSSNDPDEPDIDVDFTAVAFVRNIASADRREACLSDVDRFARLYAKKSSKEWGRCFTDELRGIACDSARRDFKIAQAEGKLRDRVGGAKDANCAGDFIVPSLLGMGSQCAAPCDAIDLVRMDDLVDCIVCTQEEVVDATLAATTGSVPPDLPPSALASDPYRCNRKLERLTENAIRKISKELARCELDNITAASPSDCTAAAATVIAREAAKIDGTLAKCKDTTGMAGCLFEPVSDPACVSAVAEQASHDLIQSIFLNP